MRRSWYRSAGSAIVMGVWLAVAGCGSVTDDDLHAPAGSEIQFTSESFTLSLAPGRCDPPGSFWVEPFTAIVTDADGVPLNDVQVTFQMSNSAFAFLDRSGTVIGFDPVLGISEVVVKSDDDGVAEVIVGVPLCVFNATDLQAFSGTAFASVHLAVEEM